MAKQGVSKSRLSWPLDHPWVFVLAAAFAVFVWWAMGTRSNPHEIRAVFTDATSLYSGLDVKVDGIDAGKVQAVDRENGVAVITVGLEDDVWPLREGATATIRFGTTVGNGTRQVEITRGPQDGRVLTEDDVIENKYTIETVEFDDIFDTFDEDTRASLQGLAGGSADTFGPRGQALGAGIEETGPGLDAVGSLARELVRDRVALRTLITDGARVTATLAARRDAIEGFVSNGAATFSTFAANQRGIVESLDRFPEALRQTRSTLARLDTSVGHLDALTTDLRPGAERLAPLAQELRPALASLRETVPNAVRTFRNASANAPAITRLLQDVQPFSGQAAPVLRDLARDFTCVRPYAPEIMAFFGQWDSWSKGFDSTAQVGRVSPNSGPTALTSTPEIDSDAIAQPGSGIKYAYIRPPGFNGGDPTFIPECGLTEDVLDPAKDPSDEFDNTTVAPGGDAG